MAEDTTNSSSADTSDELPSLTEVVCNLIDAVTPVLKSDLFGLLGEKIRKKGAEKVVTNVRESDTTGEKERHPTKEDASLQKAEANAARNNGALAHDDVEAQKGAVEATETEALADANEATALEAGASAVRTKAGLSDIETKALKMM